MPQQRGAAGPSTLLRVGAAPGWEPSAPGCCWKSVSDADTEPRSFHGAKIQPQNQPGRGEFYFPGRVGSSGELPPLVASWGYPKQAGGWGRQHRAGSIFNRGLARSPSPPSPQFAVQTTFSPRAKILAGKTPSSGETSHQGRPWPSAPGEPRGDKPPPKVGGRGRPWVCSGVWRAPRLCLTTWRGSESSPDELLPAWGWGLPLSLPLSLPLFSAWGCCSWGVEPGSDRARSSQLTLVAVAPGSAAAPQCLAHCNRAGWSPVPASSKCCWFVGPCSVLRAVRMCSSSANLWHLPAWLL